MSHCVIKCECNIFITHKFANDCEYKIVSLRVSGLITDAYILLLHQKRMRDFAIKCRHALCEWKTTKSI